jgi:hypothetical protein
MLNEFVPQKTSAYISQHDLHVGEMTVRETLDFSARCQGVGTRYGNELLRFLGCNFVAGAKLIYIPAHIYDTYMYVSHPTRDASGAC